MREKTAESSMKHPWTSENTPSQAGRSANNLHTKKKNTHTDQSVVLSSVLLALLLCLLNTSASAGQTTDQERRNNLALHKTPRLVLQIIVDQLRGDMPLRVYDRLGENGFRRLYEQGTVFENAHHRHANTETIVGHATLATDADHRGVTIPSCPLSSWETALPPSGWPVRSRRWISPPRCRGCWE